jgi:hypothetical protein
MRGPVVHKLSLENIIFLDKQDNTIAQLSISSVRFYLSPAKLTEEVVAKWLIKQ